MAQDNQIAATDEKPKSKPFRRKFTAVRADPLTVDRQGRASRLAFQRLGGRDAALAFLNAHDDGLGGRPLDVAGASPEGLAAVEALIAARG